MYIYSYATHHDILSLLKQCMYDMLKQIIYRSLAISAIVLNTRFSSDFFMISPTTRTQSCPMNSMRTSGATQLSSHNASQSSMSCSASATSGRLFGTVNAFMSDGFTYLQKPSITRRCGEAKFILTTEFNTRGYLMIPHFLDTSTSLSKNSPPSNRAAFSVLAYTCTHYNHTRSM